MKEAKLVKPEMALARIQDGAGQWCYTPLNL